MLQEHQRTLAPSDAIVSISTPVWNGHVQRAIDVQAPERLLRPELCAAVHLRFDVLNLDAWEAFRPSMPILLSKCQMLPTMALLFIFFMRSRVMILDLTAQETKMPGGLPPPGRGRHPV